MSASIWNPSNSLSPAVPFINVKDYPYLAKGDGTTDDTAAIQAAIDASATTTGATIYFPRGSYKISGSGISLPTGVNLIGESANPAGTGSGLVAASASVTRLVGINGTDISIKNMYLVGEATKAVIGIDIGHSVVDADDVPGRIRFEGVVCRLFSKGWHCVNGPFLIEWDTCVGWDCTKGWHFDNTGTFLARGINIGKLTNCHSVSCDSYGIHAVACNVISITNHGFDFDAIGIGAVDVQGLEIKYGTSDFTTTTGVLIQGGTYEITGLIIDGSALPFSIQSGSAPSQGVIKHCVTTNSSGSYSVAPATTEKLELIQNTFDLSVQNDGERYEHGYRTEYGSGTITAGGSVGVLTQAVVFSRAFSSLKNIQVTPQSNFSDRINTLVSSVSTSGFTVTFQRDDGGTWSLGNTQQYYWQAVGAN